MEEHPNLDYFNQIANGEEAVINTLISILKSEFPEQLENYNQSISTSNFKETAEAVHKLKHKIGLLGLEKGYHLAHDFEQNLRNHNFQNKKEFEDVLKNITNFIPKL
jgi:HPt (histidine-containing phosphotransfer) domain-containing protein